MTRFYLKQRSTSHVILQAMNESVAYAYQAEDVNLIELIYPARVVRSIMRAPVYEAEIRPGAERVEMIGYAS